MDDSCWEIATEDVSSLSEDTLELILTQSKLLFEDIVEVRRVTETKATVLLAALTPTILASVAAQLDLFGSVTEGIGFPIFILTVALCISFLGVLYLIVPQERYRNGSLPSDLYRLDWNEKVPSDQYKLYLATEIRSYEVRCKSNLRRSSQSANVLAFSTALVGLAVILVVIMLCLEAFSISVASWSLSHCL